MKIRTIPQIVSEVHEHDPESEVNVFMLTKLIQSGALLYDKNGNRTVTDYEHVIIMLSRMLGLDDGVFPRIRTANSSLKDLIKLGYTEEKIRSLIAEDRIDRIQIGNRSYIALEQFEFPYAERFFLRTVTLSPRESARKQATEQVSNVISNRSGAPTVKRKRKEREER